MVFGDFLLFVEGVKVLVDCCLVEGWGLCVNLLMLIGEIYLKVCSEVVELVGVVDLLVVYCLLLVGMLIVFGECIVVVYVMGMCMEFGGIVYLI